MYLSSLWNFVTVVQFHCCPNHQSHLQNVCAAAAKSLQSCPTLCDPINSSPPDSPVPGILQATTLEWVAISFSNAWKWKVKVKLLSHVRLFSDPMDCSPPGSSAHGIFPGKSTGVGCRCLLPKCVYQRLTQLLKYWNTVTHPPPLSKKDIFQDPQWLPETVIVQNPTSALFFLYTHTHTPMIKFKFKN